MPRQIQEGPGWRIGWDDSQSEFQGLLGGEHWAIELTATEYQDFCQGVQKLAATMDSMAQNLMDEETLTCEQETATLWIEADGFPQQYSLRFILLTGRNCEGSWPASVVPALLAAMDNVNVF